MRKVLLIAGVWLAASLSGFGNLLVDPGFEAEGPASWLTSVQSNRFYNFDAIGGSTNVYSGFQSMVLQWTNQIDPYSAGIIRQSIPVTPGDPWTAVAHAMVTIPLENGEAYLETIFRDAADGEVAKLQSERLSDFTWWETLVNTTSAIPDGAASADLRLVVFTTGVSSGGRIVWDETLAAVPEPATLAVTCLAGTGLWLTLRRRRVS